MSLIDPYALVQDDDQQNSRALVGGGQDPLQDNLADALQAPPTLSGAPLSQEAPPPPPDPNAPSLMSEQATSIVPKPEAAPVDALAGNDGAPDVKYDEVGFDKSDDVYKKASPGKKLMGKGDTHYSDLRGNIPKPGYGRAKAAGLTKMINGQQKMLSGLLGTSKGYVSTLTNNAELLLGTYWSRVNFQDDRLSELKSRANDASDWREEAEDFEGAVHIQLNLLGTLHFDVARWDNPARVTTDVTNSATLINRKLDDRITHKKHVEMSLQSTSWATESFGLVRYPELTTGEVVSAQQVQGAVEAGEDMAGKELPIKAGLAVRTNTQRRGARTVSEFVQSTCGHAWIEFKLNDGYLDAGQLPAIWQDAFRVNSAALDDFGTRDKTSMGFWPNGQDGIGVGDLIKRLFVGKPGEILCPDNKEGHSDAIKWFTLSNPKQLAAMLGRAKAAESVNYEALGYNCTKFTEDVMSAGGFSGVGSILGRMRHHSPNKLYKRLYFADQLGDRTVTVQGLNHTNVAGYERDKGHLSKNGAKALAAAKAKQAKPRETWTVQQLSQQAMDSQDGAEALPIDDIMADPSIIIDGAEDIDIQPPPSGPGLQQSSDDADVGGGFLSGMPGFGDIDDAGLFSDDLMGLNFDEDSQSGQAPARASGRASRSIKLENGSVFPSFGDVDDTNEIPADLLDFDVDED